MKCLFLVLAIMTLAVSTGLAQEQVSTAPAPATGKVASFETEADNPFVLRDTVTATRVTEHATDGKYALRVTAKGSDKPSWPCLFLYPKTEPNWSARQMLVMDIYLETEPIEFGAQLCALDRKDATTVSLGKLQTGWNKGVTITLQDFGWDLSRVSNLAFYPSQPAKDVIYTIDNVRWEVPVWDHGTDGWMNACDFSASGSQFETTATTAAGSNQITVKDPGDFKVGQGVTVSRCNIRYLQPRIWGPGEPYSHCKAISDEAEFRGYDGSAGSWIVYLIEIDGENPATFRWSDDLARTWKATKVPVTADWFKLSGGTEVKLAAREWKKGTMITFSARDQLMTTIDRIEGNTLTLTDAANRATTEAIVRHDDYAALQAAVKQALRQRRNLFVPNGYYRLSHGISVSNPSMTIQGESGGQTILDISDGEGPCLNLSGGGEATVRNFTMLGHTGFKEAAGAFRLSNGTDSFWASALKACSAVNCSNTGRILIENVHARRMAAEAFYCQGSMRTSDKEPEQMTRSLTWLRCSATDCAANAFNNNDCSENIYLLQSRIDGANWHAYEGPARFIRIEGCYVRNAGPFTIGDMSHRLDDLNKLGCGQAIVRDNVFEGIGRCEGVAVNHGAGQVVISDNLFINYNGPAINASSYTVRTSYPSKNITIANNIIDMTCVGEKPVSCAAINVTASGTTVANNQIYVRGKTDPRVTAIRLGEQALDVDVHDNSVRNCGTGLQTARARSSVTEVIDPKTFLEDGLPLEWENSHLYRGWNVVWASGARANTTSVIDSFDPKTLRFALKEPCDLKAGDRFEVYPPGRANWNIHDNTITGCLNPVVLDSYGSSISRFCGNLIDRGGAVGVKAAVTVGGQYQFIGNQITGFDEAGCSGLALLPDKLGKPLPNIYRDNLLTRCAVGISESKPGLWDAAVKDGNSLTQCGGGEVGMPRGGATRRSLRRHESLHHSQGQGPVQRLCRRCHRHPPGPVEPLADTEAQAPLLPPRECAFHPRQRAQLHVLRLDAWIGRQPAVYLLLKHGKSPT